MPVYDTELLKREPVAEGTMAFHFSRPAGLEFRAGQWLTFTLTAPAETDAKGSRRTFSIASAPCEETIMIATRMRDSAFKRTLGSAPPGTALQLRGPGGNFALEPRDPRPAILLAGGIGVTPFVSMLRQAAAEGDARELVLFYSSRRPEDAPFLDELDALQGRLPGYRFVPTMTEMEHSAGSWKGERGVIDAAMLARLAGPLAGKIFRVAGPPAMVTAMQKQLRDAGVPAQHIVRDEFFGY